MIDLEKYGFEPNITEGEWIHPDGFIIYKGLGFDRDGFNVDVELLTLQEFMASAFEFRGTHLEMDYYLKTKNREIKLKEILENE